MLPKSLRLKLDVDFSRVYRKGFRAHTKNFVVTTVPNTLSHPRFACIVPKTVSKKAVARNKIRRLVHEVIALQLKNRELIGLPFDVLVSAKKGSEQCDYQDIARELERPLQTIGSKTQLQRKYGQKHR